MRANALFPVPALYGALLVLTRLTGIFIFAPIPGARSGPMVSRIVLSLCITVALSPLWPSSLNVPSSIGWMAGAVGSEAALGIGMGLFVAFIAEAFTFAAQTFALQAGYSYASTIDPNTDADSGVLTVVSQQFAGMLFFAMGFDRDLLRILVRSLETMPPGTFVLTERSALAIVHAAAGFITVGVRLALPILALLVMADVALALLSRLQPQLQLLSMVFPLKMLGTVLMLAAMVGVFARIYATFGRTILGHLAAWVAR
jgi:flagellar biosynthesis protein FliR